MGGREIPSRSKRAWTCSLFCFRARVGSGVRRRRWRGGMRRAVDAAAAHMGPHLAL